MGRVAVLSIALITLCLNGCSTRALNGAYDGSTAQRLLSHSIDDLISQLPDAEFNQYKGKKLFLVTHFLNKPDIKNYADQRLKQELRNRFSIDVVEEENKAEQAMTVFYTSLATDLDNFGLTLPLGYIPGVDESTYLNIITLEKFHGVSEMYYFLGELGDQERSKTMQAKVKTDALGLPFITIPLSNLDRTDD